MTTGMRVFFSEGSREVQDVSIYYGGMGPTTVSAAKTCTAIITRSESHRYQSVSFFLFVLPLPLI